MGEILDYFKNETGNLFRNKKNLVNLLVLGILILAVPLGINLVRQQQIIKSRAAVDAITFAGSNVKQKSDGTWVATKPQIQVQLTSPLGPPMGASSASVKTVRSKALVKTVYAQDNYCADAGYHACNVGTPAGNCSKDGKTCTAYETYECNFDGQNYCGPPFDPNSQSCAEPCTGGPTPVPNDSWCTGKSGVFPCTDADMNHGVGSCQKNGKTCTQYNHFVCTTSQGVKYCDKPASSCADPCTGGSTPTPVPTYTPGPTYNPNPTPIPGGGGATRIYVDPNPVAPGSNATVIATGPTSCSTNINMSSGGGLNCNNPDVLTCGGGNPKDSNQCWWRWSCTAGSVGSYNASFNTSGSNCSSTFSYSVSGSTPTPTPTPIPPTPTPTPAPITTQFRIAESPTDLAAAEWQAYTTTVVSNPLDYTFKDTTPGQKFIFVQFMDSTGKVTTTTDCPKCQAKIRLLGPDPTLTGCSLGLEGNDAVLNIRGQNFGSDKGTIKSGNTDLQIRSWKNDNIQAVLQNAPTGQVLPVTFTNVDGQTGTSQCSSISQLALGAKVFCRAPASFDTSNVDLVLVKEDGTKTRQTVTIDKNGVVQGLTQRLENGKKYVVSIKAPKSLRRNAPFTASGGTVSIPGFILPIGDIFPIDGGDGTINALDKSELNREWNISGNATGRLGDFNQDGKINSIDWACMRYDYGKSDDLEPTTVTVPALSSSPGFVLKLGTITPEDTGFANFHLSWNEVPGTVKYNIYYKKPNDSYGAALVGIGGLSYDFHFPINANYTMKVSACNGAGSCSDSNEVTLPVNSSPSPSPSPS